MSELKTDSSSKFAISGFIFIVIALGLLFFVPNEADPSRYFVGYLLGISFWISILVGMLFLTMIFWLFDAGWAVILRRQFEHALSAFIWMGVILLPLMLFSVFDGDNEKVAWVWQGLEKLAPGGHGTVGEDVLYQKKALYLNKVGFAVRFILIFAVWSGLAYLFRKWSFRMDETGDHKYVDRSRRLAAAGIFLAAIFSSFAAIDWFKTLNYHWFSTMYGVWFFAASMRAALSTAVLILFWQAGREEGGLRGIVKPIHTYLIACLMLAFTMFWGYISFSQFFIIYNANIPEETFWYNIRELTSSGSKSGWYIISRMLIFLHFFAPFLWLLWFKNKFAWRLKMVAIWILVFHFVDLIWNIVPQKLGDPTHESPVGYIVRPLGLGVTLVDIFAWAGAGCFFLFAFLRSVHRYRAIPIRDPRINESIHYHG
tara:strand:+ start:1744 stop:3024 length:1281 start_codon:yes stop_codon:yes gene_type:complete